MGSVVGSHPIACVSRKRAGLPRCNKSKSLGFALAKKALVYGWLYGADLLFCQRGCISTRTSGATGYGRKVRIKSGAAAAGEALAGAVDLQG